MKRPSILLLCAAVAGCAAPRPDDACVQRAFEDLCRSLREARGTLSPQYCFSGEGASAAVAPEIGGRLTYFGSLPETTAALGAWSAEPGRALGTNALWNARLLKTPSDGGWRNHGGEKTWVGDMSTWRGFDPKGRRWPPPAWFDQEAFEVVAYDRAGLVLRAAPHASGDWNVGLERAFRFDGGRLVVRETLLPEPADAPQPPPEPDDPHRIWSVTQVPFAPRLAARLCGEGRTKPSAGFPEESAERHGDWVVFDLSAAPDKAALAADADALAVEGPAGWLVVSQRADARFLGAFATPGRALVYTTGAKPDDPAEAYTELEFVALGRDAAHEIAFRLAAEPPWAD